ncbi:MAG: hypothetical protein ACRDKL_12240, partial [Solirubrobacteraceae bacterium]
MLLRNRVPKIDCAPVAAAQGFEHLAPEAVAVLRWLRDSGVDHVLVGALARMARGDRAARGPVAIVPAPYGRNLDRLARALTGARARERASATILGISAPNLGRPAPLRLTNEQLLRPAGWTLSCGSHELDIEGRPTGPPSYQELLYEAARLELAQGVAVEVASPEDIEH